MELMIKRGGEDRHRVHLENGVVHDRKKKGIRSRGGIRVRSKRKIRSTSKLALQGGGRKRALFPSRKEGKMSMPPIKGGKKP